MICVYEPREVSGEGEENAYEEEVRCGYGRRNAAATLPGLALPVLLETRPPRDHFARDCMRLHLFVFAAARRTGEATEPREPVLRAQVAGAMRRALRASPM